MTMNPVEYAEQVLGVHKVYEDAQASHKLYNELMTELDNAKDKRREIDMWVEDRETVLLISQRSNHPDWSKTAVKESMKEVYNQDSELREFRMRLNALNAEIAGLEADIKVQEFLLDVFTSRMEELGGYFTFLAACKNAEQQAIQANNSPTTS